MSAYTEVLEYLTLSEQRAASLCREVGRMNNQQIMSACASHQDSQATLRNLCQSLPPVSCSEDKIVLNKIKEVVARIVEYNNKICIIAKNNMAILNHELGSMKKGRKALSGYASIITSAKKQGRLVNRAG